MAELGNNNELKGFSILAVIIAAFFIISSVITVMNVKETVVTKKNSDKINLKNAFRLIMKNDQLVVLIGTVLMFNLMVQLSGGVAIYYFKYVIGQESLFSVFTGFSGLAEITGLLLFPFFSNKIGRKKVFLLACAFPVAGFATLFAAGIIAPSNAMLVAAAGIITKIGTGFSLGISTVMLADVVDYGEFKFGSRNESVIFSVQTLLVKTASAISGWLIGMGLSLVGYVANVQQTASAVKGITTLMVFIPITLSIMGYAIYKKYYKLNDEFYDDVVKNLELKRAAA